MKTQEAISQFDYYMRSDRLTEAPSDDACRVAIAALKAKAQREQGCEYCREIKECSFDFDVRVDTYRCDDCPMTDCVHNHKGAKYCRNCGRKLDGGEKRE